MWGHEPAWLPPPVQQLLYWTHSVAQQEHRNGL